MYSYKTSSKDRPESARSWGFAQDVSSARQTHDVIRLQEKNQREGQMFVDANRDSYIPRQPRSLSGIALRAFCLGMAVSASIVVMLGVFLFTDSPLWRLPFFVAAVANFHFLEFWTTAEANAGAVTTDSFLLTSNGAQYIIVHSVAFLEAAVVCTFFPGRSWAPFGLGSTIMWLGLGLTLVGQGTRSLAMLHAGASFNHEVQVYKADTHLLVTTGIYRLIRHPSYFGFFYWGVGMQLVLGNRISFFIYVGILWWFFDKRIRYEEATLVAFFKDDYVQYRKKVSTWIPFIQ